MYNTMENRYYIVALLLILLSISFNGVCCKNTQNSNDSRSTKLANSNGNRSEKHGSIHIVQWKYNYVSVPFVFASFVALICLIKIVYHHIKPLAASLPESCLLIILGLLLGGLFYVEHAVETLKFLDYDEKTFFLFLLPPIILEAAYSLRDRAFVENIGTILLFAVVGTLLNIFLVGPILYLIWLIGGGVKIGFIECLIFSSLIAAVDPVAVLSIFQELGVNKMLYFMVFGESLFNDAVTVVIYNMMVSFLSIDQITISDLFVGVAAFFAVSFGGIVIGILFGFSTCILTKYTSHVRVVEPVIFFAMAYLSYLLAEMVHFSGIISITCCGILQGYYAMENISSKSYVSIVYFSKVASGIVESLIFIILGVMIVNQYDVWRHWSATFTFWSLLLCLSSRFIVVFTISFLINAFLKGIRRVTYEEQFIMAYGGLRGAISFSLVFMLNEELAPSKGTLLTTTYIIILFTVFFQGISIKPLVRLMRIKLDVQDSSIFNEINRAMFGNVLAGVEEIVGHRGTHYWTALFKRVSQNVVRPAVQSNPYKKSSNLMMIYQEKAIQQQLSMCSSQADVPKLAALWNQLDVLDRKNSSVSLSDMILQAQDDYFSGNTTAITPLLSNDQETKITVDEDDQLLKKQRSKPPSLSLDSPEDLLIFRDLLQSPAHKTLHYTFDKDLVSPSRRQFAHSVAHIANERLRNGRRRRVNKRAQPAACPAATSSAPQQFQNVRYLNVPQHADRCGGAGGQSGRGAAIPSTIDEASDEEVSPVVVNENGARNMEDEAKKDEAKKNDNHVHRIERPKFHL